MGFNSYLTTAKTHAYNEHMTTNNNINSFPNGIDPLFLEPEFRNTRKMPALFNIDRAKHRATETVNPKSAWIFRESSTVTLKIDGTGVVVDHDGNIFVRRTVKQGRVIPPNFRLAEFDHVTGHAFGIEPFEDSPMKKFMIEALGLTGGNLTSGTFELVGPRINGNPMNLPIHTLIPHAQAVAKAIPDMRNIEPEKAFRTLLPIFTVFGKHNVEGVVWEGTEGRRVKLRVNDFFGDPNRM